MMLSCWNWESDELLFNANSAISQLYHGDWNWKQYHDLNVIVKFWCINNASFKSKNLHWFLKSGILHWNYLMINKDYAGSKIVSQIWTGRKQYFLTTDGEGT